jgi:hypothetical protein
VEHSFRLRKRLTIKDIIFGAGKNLCLAQQWGRMQSYSRLLRYITKAECLIEIAEIMDCGSVGGFGTGRDYIENNRGKYDTLYLRWYALFRDIMPDYEKTEYLPGGFRTLEQVSDFFKTSKELAKFFGR